MRYRKLDKRSFDAIMFIYGKDVVHQIYTFLIIEAKITSLMLFLSMNRIYILYKE